ncbi:hypothetical protein BDF22DRAFT_745164 [Syncephalis plumigaleata]|nr:hypothetical protein BDF22DRAFT_745164 [Syncephalis plumigaleata]
MAHTKSSSPVGCLSSFGNWLCWNPSSSTQSSGDIRPYKGSKGSRKRINKLSIGPPKNFQHTGHIGINSMRRGNVDPNKIRAQLAEVAAILHFDEDSESTKEEEKKLISTTNSATDKETI